MAGPSIGTWVKVKNKSGRMTARVIPKIWGATPPKGAVITQSQYLEAKQKGQDANRVAKNIDKKSGKREREINEQMNKAIDSIPARFTRKREKARQRYERELGSLNKARDSALEQLKWKRNGVKGALGISREEWE